MTVTVVVGILLGLAIVGGLFWARKKEQVEDEVERQAMLMDQWFSHFRL